MPTAHELKDGKLTKESDGAVRVRCTCGWASMGHTELAACTQFTAHRERAVRETARRTTVPDAAALPLNQIAEALQWAMNRIGAPDDSRTDEYRRQYHRANSTLFELARSFADTSHVAPGIPRDDARDAAKWRAINTPELHDFREAVEREALHQRERWGTEHDGGKTPADWFWLLGYLGGKALHAHAAGNMDKALHHVITTAAACANWHAAILGQTNMRPGIEPPDGIPRDTATEFAALRTREPLYYGPTVAPANDYLIAKLHRTCQGKRPDESGSCAATVAELRPLLERLSVAERERASWFTTCSACTHP